MVKHTMDSHRAVLTGPEAPQWQFAAKSRAPNLDEERGSVVRVRLLRPPISQFDPRKLCQF